MGNPSDAADSLPVSPTTGFTEVDYSINRQRPKKQGATPLRTTFTPPKPQNVPEVKRQVFQGQCMGYASPLDEAPRFYWIRRQDGAIGRAKRVETMSDESDIRFGDHVSLIEGPEKDTWLIISDMSPNEQAAVYAQVEEVVTFPREEADIPDEEIDYDPPEEEGGEPIALESDLQQIPFKAVETYPISNQFGGYESLELRNSGKVKINKGGVYDIDVSIILGQGDEIASDQLTWSGVPLLTFSESKSESLREFAKKLAKQYGINVEGVNELYVPSGMLDCAAMIGVIEDARVATLISEWSDFITSGAPAASLPALVGSNFTRRLQLVAVVRYDATVVDDPGTVDVDEADPLSGLHLCVFADPRYNLLRIAAKQFVDTIVSDDWATVIGNAIPSGLFNAPSIAGIAAAYLKPEGDLFYTRDMTAAEWLDAAAWSVGKRWYVAENGTLTLQTPSAANTVVAANKAEVWEIVEGEFIDIGDDQWPLKGIRLGAVPAYGAVPYLQDTSIYFTDIDDEGFLWYVENVCLSEQSPYDSSYINDPELQTLAEQLLDDAQLWTDGAYCVRYGTLVDWAHSARDKYVLYHIHTDGEWVEAASITVNDLPKRLVNRSSVMHRPPGLCEGVTVTTGSAGGSVGVDLLASVGRPSYRVSARYPSHPGGLSVSSGQSVWVQYYPEDAQWILPPWTTL